MNNHAGGANDDGHIKINKKKREDILDDEGLHLKPLYALLDNTVIITIEGPEKKPTSQKKDQKRDFRGWAVNFYRCRNTFGLA